MHGHVWFKTLSKSTLPRVPAMSPVCARRSGSPAQLRGIRHDECFLPRPVSPQRRSPGLLHSDSLCTQSSSPDNSLVVGFFHRRRWENVVAICVCDSQWAMCARGDRWRRLFRQPSTRLWLLGRQRRRWVPVCYILCSPFAEAMVDCPESEIDKELVAGDAQWNGALRGGGLRLRHGLVRLRKCPQQRSPQVLNLASVSPYDHRFGVWNTCMSRFDWGSVSQIDLVQGSGEEEGEGRPDCAAARLGRPRRAGISIPKELCWELYPFYFKFRLVCMRVGCDWLCMSVIGFVWEGKYSDADWTNQKLHRSSRGSRLLTRSLVAAKTSASERVASQTPDVQLSLAWWCIRGDGDTMVICYDSCDHSCTQQRTDAMEQEGVQGD